MLHQPRLRKSSAVGLSVAEHLLRDGISYCTDHDLDSWRLYMEAELPVCSRIEVSFDDAARLARDVLRHPNLSPVTKIDAFAAAGSVAIRRGRPDAEVLLTQAQALAEPPASLSGSHLSLQRPPSSRGPPERRT